MDMAFGIVIYLHICEGLMPRPRMFISKRSIRIGLDLCNVNVIARWGAQPLRRILLRGKSSRPVLGSFSPKILYQ